MSSTVVSEQKFLNVAKNKFDLIALVDDNSATNFYHKIVIRNAEISKDVLSFEVGEEALRYLEKNTLGKSTPMVIFLDINMPKITGWEFLERFKNISFITRPWVVMMTSHLNDEIVQMANAHPLVYKVITKSITQEQLVSIHKEIIQGGYRPKTRR